MISIIFNDLFTSPYSEGDGKDEKLFVAKIESEENGALFTINKQLKLGGKGPPITFYFDTEELSFLIQFLQNIYNLKSTS